jgi:hypothetical protein
MDETTNPIIHSIVSENKAKPKKYLNLFLAVIAVGVITTMIVSKSTSSLVSNNELRIGTVITNVNDANYFCSKLRCVK